MCGFTFQGLKHYGHQRQQRKEVHRHKLRPYILRDKTEQGRHKACSHIRACHLHSDYCLRQLCAEVGGSGVNNTGIYRRAAKTYQNKAGKCRCAPRNEQQRSTEHDNRFPGADKVPVGKLARKKAVYRAADGYTDKKQPRKASGGFRADAGERL